jgi:hypothetical protein
MPATKIKTKKPAAKKPAKKAAQKVTLDDLLTIVADIGKAHKELEEAHKETEKAHNETEKTLNKFVDDIRKGQKELEEAHKETEKAIRETQEAHKETEKAIRETQEAHKETEKAIRETQRNIGGLNNTMGSLVEHIMTPGLPLKFKQLGFTFNRITTVKWAVEGNVYAEIDGLLENGTQAMAVEVKTTLRGKDIDDHVRRMERIRAYADKNGDKREFMGAMAATIIDSSTKTYALSKGLFIIEPSGEDVKIVKPAAQKVW